MTTTETAMTLTDMKVVKVELHDPDVMDALLCDTASFSKKDLGNLGRYKRGRKHGNRVEVVYSYGRGCEDAKLGRLYAKGGQGIQAFPFDIRNPLIEKFYWDCDIENAHYNILAKLGQDWGVRTENIQKYIQNRDAELKKVSENRLIAKTAFLKVAYGGNIKLYSDFADNDGIEPEGDVTLLKQIEKEMSVIVELCWTKFPQHHKLVKSKANPKFSLFALILQTEERKCLLAMDAYLKSRGRSMDILIHDGGEVRKLPGEEAFPDELLRGMEQAIHDELGYTLKIVVKPFKHNFQKPDDGSILSADILVDDAYASRVFVGLMEDRVILDSVLWLFDDTNGIWTPDHDVFKRKMVEFGSKLVFKQSTPLGVKVHNYSGDVAHQDRLLKCLPAVVQKQTGFFADRLESSVNKLLFTDGIYDFTTRTFTKGFDPDVVFFGAVPRPFPTQKNTEAMEFVRTKFFRDPFKNPKVGDTLLHYFARAVAGHYEAKKAVVAYGPENSTKGTVTKHMETTLGPGLIGSFQGDSLLMRTGDVEATKSLSWVKKFCDKRIAYSSEISVDKEKRRPINGNLLKSLSGGGDGITLRTNHKDEETVVNKALTFVFVNDLPEFSPVDGSLRDRLVTIPYSYAFVDEPKFAYQKKRDHTVSKTLKTDLYRDATIWLLLDTMAEWDGQPYALPEECKALKDDLAPMANIEELLSEEYDLTGNPDDSVPTEELVLYLRQRKVDGSDRKIGDKLTQIGLETTVRREGRRTVRVRVGIRKGDA
jgi:hypothetical protein